MHSLRQYWTHSQKWCTLLPLSSGTLPCTKHLTNSPPARVHSLPLLTARVKQYRGASQGTAIFPAFIPPAKGKERGKMQASWPRIFFSRLPHCPKSKSGHFSISKSCFLFLPLGVALSKARYSSSPLDRIGKVPFWPLLGCKCYPPGHTCSFDLSLDLSQLELCCSSFFSYWGEERGRKEVMPG